MGSGLVIDRFQDSRAARLEQVLPALRARFGEWIVYRLTEARPSVGEQVIATGSLGLDAATRIGGVPRGRLTDLGGPPTSGKSTIAFHVLANAQRQQGFAALIDAGHTVDCGQLRRSGVDLSDLLLVVPQSAREAFDIACLLIASGGLDALVINTANSLVGGPFGDPIAFSAGLRRLIAELSPVPTAVVVLVQANGRWRRTEQNAWRALAHGATLRVACRPMRLITHASGEILGLRLRAEVVKNKLAAPHGAAEFEIWRDRGIHATAELFTLGLTQGLIGTRPGSLGYWFGETWLGRGQQSVVQMLDEDPLLSASLRDALCRRIREASAGDLYGTGPLARA